MKKISVYVMLVIMSLLAYRTFITICNAKIDATLESGTVNTGGSFYIYYFMNYLVLIIVLLAIIGILGAGLFLGMNYLKGKELNWRTVLFRKNDTNAVKTIKIIACISSFVYIRMFTTGIMNGNVINISFGLCALSATFLFVVWFGNSLDHLEKNRNILYIEDKNR